MGRLCSIEGCGKPHDAYNYCRAHGARYKRHGSPLAGGNPMPPRGEIKQYYETRVLTESGDACLVWPYSRQGAGYGEIWLDGRRGHVHRLACEHAHGPPPTPRHEAAHSCGNGHKGCVNPTHLRWATKAENAADRRVHGTDTVGERNGCSVLTREDVVAIRAMWPATSQAEIAAQYAVTRQAVWQVVHRKNWAWLHDHRN